MTARPPEHLVHGINGPIVIVSARVCAYLNKYAGLDQFRRDNRGADGEVDNTLIAFRLADITWREAATGTREAAKPELDPEWEWVSSTEAAARLGVGDRAIRKAIAEHRLQAEQVAGRWRISRENFEHYRAARVAQAKGI